MTVQAAPKGSRFFLRLDNTAADGMRHARDALMRLIDRAIGFNGSYYQTYHRHADLRQVETCYPPFRKFLERKHAYDPEGRCESDWYRHYRDLFAVV